MEQPINSVSILVASYNTKPIYITECIDSIINQNGNFAIELVWINDGTDKDGTLLLKQELQRFQKTKKNAKVIYKKQSTNMGLSYCLHEGVLLCSNEIIFRMDSDDIMAPERLNIQYNFMHNTPDCVLCGSDMITFTSNNNSFVSESALPILGNESRKRSSASPFRRCKVEGLSGPPTEPRGGSARFTT